MTHLEQFTHNPFLITGYTTRYHLLLDLDSISLSQAIGLTHLLQRQYPKLGDALICSSSEEEKEIWLRYTKWGLPKVRKIDQSFHTIFNNVVGYNFCQRLCNLLVALDTIDKQAVRIRAFRNDMTLRVSPKITSKGIKPIPKPIAYIPNRYTKKHDGMIGEYLKFLQYSRNCFHGYHTPICS